MNFLSRMKFKNNPNQIVRLAIENYDRPTDLKESIIKLNIDFQLAQDLVLDAEKTLSKHPAVANDVRLAFFRAYCSDDPSRYASILSTFPKLLLDFRAEHSLELYKNRALNQFLGIEVERHDEKQNQSRIYFDDTMFENVDYTEFENSLDEDFGLIEFANRKDRTLNQLRDKIQSLILSEGINDIKLILEEIQKYLLGDDYSERTYSDFFVATLRAIGEYDHIAGIDFGKKFFSAIPDHRGLRSMVIFLRRNGDYVDALKILHHPNFKHDETTMTWTEDLMIVHKEMMLEGKLRPKYDEFDGKWDELEEYMQSLYDTMDADIEIARYNYSYALKIHKSTPDRFLTKSVIKWGSILLSNSKTYSDTVSIHVSNAFINLGKISKAIEILEQYANPKSSRIAAKFKGYNDLLKLKESGFSAEIDIDASNYQPIPGRVLYVLHNSLPYNSGGYATRGHGLMCGVKKMGWDVHVVTRRGYPHDRKGMRDNPTDELQIIDEIPYHRLIELEKGYGQTNIRNYLESYANHLAEKVAELRPSIIHAASNHLNGLVSNVVGKHFAIPTIYEIRGLWEITRISRQPEFEHSEYFDMMSKLETESACGADYVFTITNALADEMRRRSKKLSEIGFLPNGVHSDRFVHMEPDIDLKKELDIDEDAVVIGYIGSLVSYEGLDLLINSLPLVQHSTEVKFKLLIVGDGAYMEKLQDLTNNLGLTDLVLFTGRVPHEEVERYYSIVDIAPFPRLPQPVTEMVSPLKPFEAMAMEKAVIASDVHALAEIVQHEETGLLFEKGNATSLSDTLTRLINDSKLRSNYGKAARIWVEQKRDWNSISLTLDNVYTKLTEGK